MYDLHRLRLLRELDHRGTLAAVAAALGYDPSSVSHQLGVLEREVGVPLLEPMGRRVRLTPAAEALVAHTEVILRELERAETAIAATRTEVAGRVRVATFQTAAHTLLIDAIGALADRHPGLEVSFSQLTAEAAIPALVAREVDVVLSERYPGQDAPPPRAVLTRTLMADPLRLAVPERWPARTLADLADAPWVMEHAGAFARSWAVPVCRTAGFEPDVRFTSADVYLHAELVAQGRAAAFLPRLGPRPGEDVRFVATGAARLVTVSRRDGSEGNPAIDAVDAALETAALRWSGRGERS